MFNLLAQAGAGVAEGNAAAASNTAAGTAGNAAASGAADQAGHLTIDIATKGVQSISVEEENGVERRVEDIWIRMMLVRKVTDELVCVPNATIAKSAVRLLTNKTHRRQMITVGVAYGEDVDEARQVIKDAVVSCDLVHNKDNIQVFACEFADSSINFEVAWWTRSKPIDLRKSADQSSASSTTQPSKSRSPIAR